MPVWAAALQQLIAAATRSRTVLQFSAIQGTPADGIAISGGGDLQGPIEDNRWYDISLIVTKNSAEMLLDGKRVSRVEANALPAFFATAGYRKADGTVVGRARQGSQWRPGRICGQRRLPGRGDEPLKAANRASKPHVRSLSQECPAKNQAYCGEGLERVPAHGLISKWHKLVLQHGFLETPPSIREADEEKSRERAPGQRLQSDIRKSGHRP